jgi:3-hydroxyacyl-[acyl-carrier-protein] dehydratase
MMNWSHVDTILELNVGRTAKGAKLVAEGGFLDGHFPGRPIQPGVLTLEGLIEVAKHLLLGETENVSQEGQSRPELVRIEKAAFMDMVVPGEKMTLEVTIIALDEREARFKGRALVGETLKAQATFILRLKRPEI